jgi:hypothetical protein
MTTDKKRAPQAGRPFQKHVATNDTPSSSIGEPSVQADDLTTRPAAVFTAVGGVYSARLRQPRSRPYGPPPAEAERHEVIQDLRFQRACRHLHGLGPRALSAFLAELGAERSIRTPIEQKLESFSRLTREQCETACADLSMAPRPLRAGVGSWR